MPEVIYFLKVLRQCWKEEYKGKDLSSIELMSLSKKVIDKQVSAELKDKVYSFLNKAIKNRVKKKIILNSKELFGDLECFNLKWLDKQIKKQQMNKNK